MRLRKGYFELPSANSESVIGRRPSAAGVGEAALCAAGAGEGLSSPANNKNAARGVPCLVAARGPR